VALQHAHKQNGPTVEEVDQESRVGLRVVWSIFMNVAIKLALINISLVLSVILACGVRSVHVGVPTSASRLHLLGVGLHGLVATHSMEIHT
jgi:hypothetical protein